jgi:hypothetical protein
LEDPDVNASDLINRMLRHYRDGGRLADVALGMRLEELRREREDAEAEISRLESRVSDIRDEERRLERKLENKETRLDSAVDEFLGLDGTPALDPDNAAVKNYAAKAGVPAEQFVEEVEARR